MVNSPKHYNLYPIEAIDMAVKIWGKEKVKDCAIITAFFYRMRLGLKDGIEQELAKEKWWLDKYNELNSIDEIDTEKSEHNEKSLIENSFDDTDQWIKLAYDKLKHEYCYSNNIHPNRELIECELINGLPHNYVVKCDEANNPPEIMALYCCVARVSYQLPDGWTRYTDLFFGNEQNFSHINPMFVNKLKNEKIVFEQIPTLKPLSSIPLNHPTCQR